MQTESRSQEVARGAAAAGEDFRWLPASRARRALIWVALAALTAVVFAAYLSPNMVFDLANFIFCG